MLCLLLKTILGVTSLMYLESKDESSILSLSDRLRLGAEIWKFKMKIIWVVASCYIWFKYIGQKFLSTIIK